MKHMKKVRRIEDEKERETDRERDGYCCDRPKLELERKTGV